MSEGVLRMPTDEFEIAATTRSPGWIGMPELGDAEADRAWLREWTDRMGAGFGARWSADAAQLVPALLHAGLDRRQPGDLLAWQVWPAAMPVFATVRARVVASSGVPAWGSDGETVQPFDSAGLGPGVVVHARAALGDSGEQVAAVLYAFDDGATSVVVSMEPTLLELLSLCAAGLRELVDGMELTRPDGSRFRGVDPAGFIRAESWSDTERAA